MKSKPLSAKALHAVFKMYTIQEMLKLVERTANCIELVPRKTCLRCWNNFTQKVMNKMIYSNCLNTINITWHIYINKSKKHIVIINQSNEYNILVHCLHMYT